MLVPLLQVVVDGQTALPTEERHYAEALAAIEQFSLAPQVYSLLEKNGRLADVPEFFRIALRKSYEGVFGQNLFIRHEEDAICQSFEQACIDVIPLKGTRFAERYFGHFAARGTTDIDLLVRPSGLLRAIACLQTLGFSLDDEQTPDHFHSSLSKKIPGSSYALTVELHWSLTKGDKSRLRMEPFWASALPIGGYAHVKELSVPHTFYAICLHGANHHMIGFKYLLDIMQVIVRHSGELDLELLLREAALDRTRGKVEMALSVAYRPFPSLQGILPFRVNRLSRLWTPAMAEKAVTGKFGIRRYIHQLAWSVLVHDMARYHAAGLYDYFSGFFKRAMFLVIQKLSK